MNKPAAIYARVSSDRQKENHTIASQTAALIEYAQKNGYSVPPEWVFQDEGYSGAILVRPGLEALRDLAAEGQIAAALIYSPDRLSRKYAYQVLLSEELSRCGVELVFLKAPAGTTPEDQLLVQFQEMFALAQEQLEKNKRHSPRRTIEPTLLQGMLVCEQCGYGLYRTSTRTSKQKLNYYRCIGSDGYRRLNGPVCTNRPIRQDYLDQFVWSEIIRLLDDPELIQTEIDRRREAAQKADPLRKREEELRREQVRIEKNSQRLITAYQEGLVTLAQLRQRMPSLQKQAHAVEAELQSLEMAAVDQAKYL